MGKDKLFELIRNEEVVLWIGAGFSRYAGYPDSGKLAQIIFDDLTNEEKMLTADTKSLLEIADDYVTIKESRDSLIKLLQNSFISYLPLSTTDHDILSKIPHIKTIITTNYDTLIESSYGRNCVIIVEDNHVPSIRRGLTTIIKIHGDFSAQDKMVITKGDYRNFHTKDLDTPLWNLVKERISTKSIAFLGYGFEDPNIIAIFDKILKLTAENKKDIFFIAPKITKLKEKELSLKKIIHVKMSGSEFVRELMENINKNITVDFAKNLTSMDTVSEYLKSENLYGIYKPTEKGNSITELLPITGEAQHKFTFKIKDKDINDRISNMPFEEIHISSESLFDSDYYINVIRRSEFTNSKFTVDIIPTPEKTNMNIYFADQDFELNDIPLEILRGNNEAKFTLNLSAGKVVVLFKHAVDSNVLNLSLTFEHKNGLFCRPFAEIEYGKLFLYLCTEKHFRIVTDSGLNLSYTLKNLNASVERVEKDLDYFEKLKVIERHYGIVFNNIGEILESDVYNVDLICKNIQGNILDNSQDITMKIGPDNFEEDVRDAFLCDDVFDLTYANESNDLYLHGHRIELGYLHVIVQNPEYPHKDKLAIGENAELYIICRAQSYIVRYDKHINLINK